jgi:hypothetical protein
VAAAMALDASDAVKIRKMQVIVEFVLEKNVGFYFPDKVSSQLDRY